MSGISVFRLGATALVAILLLVSPLAYAASSPTTSEAEQSPIGFFSFVMSLFSEAWESEADENASWERHEPLPGESDGDPERPPTGDPTRQQPDGDQQEQQGGGGGDGGGVDPDGGG